MSDEYAKVLGGLEPNKLATEMADFANKQTVDEKLKWIRDKRAVYADSPIWPLVQGWEDILTRTAKATKAADVPALSPKNIDIQAKSLVRALGGSERVLAASAGEDATVSAMGNIARSGATSTLGGKISGALSTAALGLGIPTVQRGTDLAAEALTQALQNPELAAEFVAKAQRLQQMSPRLAAQRSQQLTDALNTIAPQAAAFGRGVMGLGSPEPIAQQATTPSVPPATTTPTVESDPWAELESAVGPMAGASPTPESTPEPETITVGKQNISIPTGDKYAPADLVKAVIMAESAGNANAVSPKGAGGLMQIMPATAKILGVKNRFNPVENVDGGSRYLKEQLVAAAQETGKEDPKLAAAAYNWGPGNLSKAIRQVKAEGEVVTWDNIKSIVKVPEETRTYVDRVMLLRKYDDYDLAKIAAKVGEQKLDAVLNKFKTGKKFTVGDILDELGIDAKSVKVKRNNVLQSASNLTEA